VIEIIRFSAILAAIFGVSMISYAVVEAPARRWLKCSVPESRGAILTRESEEALWQTFFTAAPAQRREFEPSSKRRKRRPVSSPASMV